jgi:hypothetical protein
MSAFYLLGFSWKSERLFCILKCREGLQEIVIKIKVKVKSHLFANSLTARFRGGTDKIL